MVRKIGNHQAPEDYLNASKERIMAMEALASTHIAWFTHKNPYGCWICDLFLLTYRLIDSFEEFLGPRGSDEPEPTDTSEER